MATTNYAEFVVTDDNGEIDLNATIQSFANGLVAWNETRQHAQEQVGIVIGAIFDENVGKVLPMPYVHSQAVSRLGAEASTHNFYTEAVKTYLKANTWDGKKGERKLLLVKKGMGGGVQLTTAAEEAAANKQ